MSIRSILAIAVLASSLSVVHGISAQAASTVNGAKLYDNSVSKTSLDAKAFFERVQRESN